MTKEREFFNTGRQGNCKDMVVELSQLCYINGTKAVVLEYYEERTSHRTIPSAKSVAP